MKRSSKWLITFCIFEFFFLTCRNVYSQSENTTSTIGLTQNSSINRSDEGGTGGHNGPILSGPANAVSIDGAFTFRQLSNQLSKCYDILAKNFIQQLLFELMIVSINREVDPYGYPDHHTPDPTNPDNIGIMSGVTYNVFTDDMNSAQGIRFDFFSSNSKDGTHKFNIYVNGTNESLILSAPKRNIMPDGDYTYTLGSAVLPYYEFKTITKEITFDGGFPRDKVGYTDLKVVYPSMGIAPVECSVNKDKDYCTPLEINLDIYRECLKSIQ